ncbi:unnamed protein product (macronuclear) [Paramecium tetraurelia]|uniref:Uncharacterized protein n=1 Tax=Paramecium tetraurelia TaxID=5888 RepID=A0EF13_PARTE|nr:uncharacterized protein GSPATT00026227001 [Paramecium tetraurelia]CAK93904.1 unnamed protein product [Paramecium tetraurelia]|eukprot:XP_001461277.1 hypothetical protein (macronuclear) [Paramecium tetraurelia strain d4-2]
MWDFVFEQCKESDNYLIGCNIYINKVGCTSQLGSSIAKVAYCKFDGRCQQINDLESEQCSDNLNRYGCLAIQNPHSICKWENNQCLTVTGQDINKIQENFNVVYYSSNACQYVTNYLVIHHTVLWELLSYEPDLQWEVNQYILNSAQKIDQDLSLLQNSYTRNQFFKPFMFGEKYQTESNRFRLGCNAIDIRDDDDFNLLINLSQDTFGVNHLYCKYVEKNTSFVIFMNGRCQQVSPALLATTSFIDDNQIQCKQLSYQLCSIYKSKTRKCYIPNKTQEFTCREGESKVDLDQECMLQRDFEPYYRCEQIKYCYFDINKQYCSNFCFSLRKKPDCLSSGICLWQGIDENEQNDLLSCMPLYGCNQLGIDIYYCKYLQDYCDWQDGHCFSMSEAYAFSLTCQQAFNKYVCLKIQKSDQHCIWYNEQCINFIDYELKYLFNTLPYVYKMNRNMCINFRKDNFMFNPINYQCEYQVKLQINCNNRMINKYHCYNIVNDLCKWDDYLNQCMTILNSDTYYCNQLTNVSFRVCLNAKVRNPTNDCLYDWESFSCYEGSQQDQLIQEESDCYNVNVIKQFRQWNQGKCVELSIQEVNNIQCISWRNVNRNVCVMNVYSNQPCIYDEKLKLCYNDIIINNCSSNFNRFACLQSTSKCYYDILNDKCMDTSQEMLSQLSCTAYVSQSTCKSIETQNQKCMWDTYFAECRQYDQLFQYCDQFQLNRQACTSQRASTSIQYHYYHHCQFNESTLNCEVRNDVLTDCGASQSINFHRCVQYTTGTCLFDQNKCFDVSNTSSRLDQLYLSEMLCEQANADACKQIANPSQGCKFTTFQKFDYIDTRCTNQEFNKSTCTSLAASTSTNKIICSKATDNCYYSTTSMKCIALTSSIIPYCHLLAMSQTACLQWTIGKCIFYQDQCQYHRTHNPVACEVRNYQACITSNQLKCVYNSNLKQCLPQSFDCIKRVDSILTYSWSTCSMSAQNCYGFNSQCIVGQVNNVPCDLPGLSQSVCKSQNIYCEFLNGYCQFQLPRTCNEIINKDQCVNNKLKGQYCVFHNSICFNVTELDSFTCNQFDYTSFHFCKQYPNCSYDFTTNLCQIKETTLSQNCLDNNTNNLLYQYINNECVHVESNIPSCLSIQNIQVNYNLCQTISDNDNNQCAYDFNTHLCKLTYYSYFNSCSDIQSEIQCIFANLACYANYVNSVYQSCTSSSLSASSKINRYGCVQIETAAYLFNNDDWTCPTVSIRTDNLKLMHYTNQLNQKACYLLGSVYSPTLYLRWYNKECVELTLKQATYLTSCANLNKNACLAVARLNCQWNSNDNLCSEDTKTQFAVTSCEAQVVATNLNSQGLCAKISGLKCIQKSNQQGCESLATTTYKSVFKCTGLGLNREACLTETKLANCYWKDDICEDANFILQKCEDDVSEYTCKNITRQICQWTNSKCSIKIEDFTSCQLSNGYINFCRNNQNLKCKYNQQTNSCESFSYTPVECDTTYSKFACRSVINKTCEWNNNQCQEILEITSCLSIYNQQSCLLNDVFSCIWDTNKGCLEYVLNHKVDFFNLPATANKNVCIYYSKQETTYVQYKCTNILNYNQIQYKSSIDLGDPIVNIACQSQLTLSDCLQLHTPNTYCQWIHNQCMNIQDDSTFSTLSCNADINVWTCLRITNPSQNCKWSNLRCLNYQEGDQFMINVNINVCRNFSQNRVYMNNSCIVLDDIHCDSEGISKFTCVNNKNYACQYVDNQCVNFQIQSKYSQCSEITNVSIKACSLIPQLKCQYGNNNSCVNYVDNTKLEGISKFACLSKSGYYYWHADQCKLIDIKLYCDDDLQVTRESCVLIKDKLCLFNSANQTCTSIYNPHQLTCSTIGLNKQGCMKVLYEPCIFKDNKCQYFDNLQESYISLSNVNELTCRMLANGYVEYNEIEERCVYQLTKTKCDNLNINACKQLSYCIWNHDFSKCGCPPSTEVCYNLSKQDCQMQNSCRYQQNVCSFKQCQHLSQNECEGQTLNNLKCYLNKYKQCAQASRCEDIIDSYDCQNIYFKGTACLQIVNTSQCYSYNNFELICKYSESCLNQYCIFDGTCKLKQCNNIKEQQECEFTKNCAFINNQCQLIKSCQEINDPAICNQLTVNNQKCNWQQQNLLDTTKICTSQSCSMLGTSSSLCHGNEVNNYACVLRNYKCVQCEFIKEVCECNSYKGICYFINNQCSSLLCNDLMTSAICSQSPKCEWSQLLNSCTLQCNYNYQEELCLVRKDECHWNQYKSFCQSGPESIPTLFNSTKSNQNYQQHLLLPLVIMLYL